MSMEAGSLEVRICNSSSVWLGFTTHLKKYPENQPLPGRLWPNQTNAKVRLHMRCSFSSPEVSTAIG